MTGNLIRHRLAAFDTTGNLLDWDPDVEPGNDTDVLPNLPAPEVKALTVSGNTVYAGGTFTSVFDITQDPSFVSVRNRLAAFQAWAPGNEFGFVTDWNPNVGGEVDSIAVSGSTVYAGGSFTTVNGGTARNRLAGFDATSAAATAFDPNVNGDVNSIAVSGSTLYAGGSFTQVGSGTTRWGAAAFELGGGGEFRGASAQAAGDPTAWDPHLVKVGGGAGEVNALANAGSTVYLGGDFDYIGSCAAVACQGAAGAVNASTGALISAWLPEPNATVNAVTLGQDGVLLGGPFTAIGYPRPGATYASPEPAAVPRAGVALVRGLPEPPANVSASPARRRRHGHLRPVSVQRRRHDHGVHGHRQPRQSRRQRSAARSR